MKLFCGTLALEIKSSTSLSMFKRPKIALCVFITVTAFKRSCVILDRR